MNTDLIPVVEVPYFLVTNSGNLSIILITILALFILFSITFFTRIKKIYRIYLIIKDCKNNKTTQREAAYRLTTISSMTFTKPSLLYDKRENEIIRNIKYKKHHQESKEDLMPILYKAIYSSFLGKY